MMKGKNFLRFSFKKFVAVGLSCMMFLQCSNLSFAGECDDISKINKNCLSNYSSEQLNDIIDSIKASADSNGIDIPTGNLQ